MTDERDDTREERLLEEFGLDADALDAFEAPTPPEGFADSVMRAARAAPKKRAGWGAWLAMAAALALMAGGLALGALTKDSGALTASTRTTREVGPVVLVAESGAALEWTLGRTGGVVTQQTGDVFYRVDGPTDVRVRTPGGEVSVLGTCFRVQIAPREEEPQMTNGPRRLGMRAVTAAAVVGAALGAVVTVTVYEGRVALANDEGSVSVEAGQAAVASDGQAPSLQPTTPDVAGERERVASQEAGTAQESASGAAENALRLEGLEPSALREEAGRLRAQNIARQAEIERLRTQLDEGEPPLSRQRWYPPSESELVEMAERCTLQIDTPPVMGVEPGEVGDYRERLGLDRDEEALVDEAITRVHARFRGELAALYVEATGDSAGDLSPQAMLAELRDKGLRGEVAEVRQRIARERAGMSRPTPESTWGVAERAYRLFAGVPDQLQATLADSLGPERAHEVRAASGGWPWGRSQFSGCPGE